jgi:hypothetical protein
LRRFGMLQKWQSSWPIGSMVLLYMVTWIPSIYPLYVSIYTSTMDPMGKKRFATPMDFGVPRFQTNRDKSMSMKTGHPWLSERFRVP